MYVSIIQTILRRPARGSSPCGRLAHGRPTPVDENLGWFSGQGSDVVLGERHQRRDVAHVDGARPRRNRQKLYASRRPDSAGRYSAPGHFAKTHVPSGRCSQMINSAARLLSRKRAEEPGRLSTLASASGARPPIRLGARLAAMRELTFARGHLSIDIGPWSCGCSAGRGGQLQSPQKGPLTARPVRLERPAVCF
jgi:hypothetical protein